MRLGGAQHPPCARPLLELGLQAGHSLAAGESSVISLASPLHPCWNAYERETGVQRQNDSLADGYHSRRVAGQRSIRPRRHLRPGLRVVLHPPGARSARSDRRNCFGSSNRARARIAATRCPAWRRRQRQRRVGVCVGGPCAAQARPRGRWRLAAGDSSVIQLHPPLRLAGVSIDMERGCQQNDSLADG